MVTYCQGDSILGDRHCVSCQVELVVISSRFGMTAKSVRVGGCVYQFLSVNVCYQIP